MNTYSRRLIGIGVLFLSVCILSSSKFLSRKLIVNKSKLQTFLSKIMTVKLKDSD